MNGKLHRRMRRLRSSEAIRDMVRENYLHINDLIYPVFVEENIAEPTPVNSMPGIYRQSESSLADTIKQASNEGIRSVILFGVSHNKDDIGGDSLSEKGLLYRMIDRAKNACPDMAIIADICFCEYTDHGHCGPLHKDMRGHYDVDNDSTLENLAIQSLIAAKAGADIIAPSGMMDGMVTTIRNSLDDNGYKNLPIMSYAAKFASSFYGPFRDAAGCSLGKGNRKTYQMDPACGRQAMIEAYLDEEEGADIIMVKPGMPYLDVLANLRSRTDLPLAAYQVSGEYSMIKHAAIAGAIDEQAVMMESLLAFKRAGADMILTYFARDAAKLINRQAIPKRLNC